MDTVGIRPKLLQFGPLMVTFIMVVGSELYYPWRHYDSWPSYGIVFGIFGLAVWHLVLITMYRPMSAFIIYAIANLTLYVLLAVSQCLGNVTGDWL
jgi:hypothetical protein